MQRTTEVVLFNMGGPTMLDDVERFLTRMFEVREIFQLPFPQTTGRWFARLRTPKVRANYAAIGDESPIMHWTEAQAEGLARFLDERAPATAPHKTSVAFRYTDPLNEAAPLHMRARVENAETLQKSLADPLADQLTSGAQAARQYGLHA